MSTVKSLAKIALVLAGLIAGVGLLASLFTGAGERAVAQGDYKLLMPFIPKKLNTGPGTVIGKVLDSTTQAPPTLATARVCYGTNCVYANANGEYVLPNVPYGYRILTASADYYFPVDSPVLVKGGDTVVLNFAIYPSQPGGTRAMEVVLTWRSEPTWPGQGCDWEGNPDPSGNCLNDLDTHFWVLPFVETPEIPRVHIDAGNRDKWGVLDRYPSARLRFDERWGSGPETLQVRAYEDAIYHYAVLNVYQYFSSTVPPMRDTQARVYARDGTGQLLLDLTVPVTGNGELWYVFTLNGETGDITIVNCLTDLPGADLEPPTCP